MNLGEKIKVKRKEKGYTQESLATAMNTSRQTIHNWETSFTSPSIDDLKQLTKILNCSYEYFLNDQNTRDINNVNDVVSDIYKGVKKHWRKVYIYFFVSGAIFCGMGILSLIMINSFTSGMNQNNPFSMDTGFMNAIPAFIIIIGVVLIIFGIIFYIKDKAFQSKN